MNRGVWPVVVRLQPSMPQQRLTGVICRHEFHNLKNCCPCRGQPSLVVSDKVVHSSERIANQLVVQSICRVGTRAVKELDVASDG